MASHARNGIKPLTVNECHSDVPQAVDDDDTSISVLVDKVLSGTKCTENRASKMDIDDLLKFVLFNFDLLAANLPYRLLSAFHDVGIHFS